MERSKSLGSRFDLMESIADSMRQFNFSEEAIEDMKKNAATIDLDLLEHMVNVINGAKEEDAKRNIH
jgi:hypothetical protein